MREFDYVILGGGSAGCVLARRLSEEPEARVLLVEAGGKGNSLFIRMPAANGLVFGRPRFDWGYRSVPQEALGGRRITYPRGRGLGGSSNINGMIYIRGNPQDYDAWRQSGLAGWAFADLLPYFKRAEANARGADPYHGADGPLGVGPPGNVGTLDRLFLEAAQQAGLAYNPDFNGAGQIGCGLLDFTVAGGRRSDTGHAYLAAAAGRPNLEVMTGALACGLLLDGARAVGVKLLQRGRACEIRAAREVILALGAFGSPQLLLLSGIGPAEEIRRHGLTVAVDLPGVGANLQDHFNIPIQVACRDPELTLARYQRPDRALWLGLRYLLNRQGPGAAALWSAGAFQGPADGAARPELQMFFTPMIIDEDLYGPENQESANSSVKLKLSDFGKTFLTRGRPSAAGYQIDVNQMHPESRGRVTLASADPRDHPRIDPRFLSEPRDREEAVAAVRAAREILHQPAFAAVRGPELSPGPEAESDADILAALRRVLGTGHHPAGSCKMGRADDPSAVVDSELRVRGVDGLRVADASVFPSLMTGNTNAPVIMVAEKAADMILGRPPPPRAEP